MSRINIHVKQSIVDCFLTEGRVSSPLLMCSANLRRDSEVDELNECLARLVSIPRVYVESKGEEYNTMYLAIVRQLVNIWWSPSRIKEDVGVEFVFVATIDHSENSTICVTAESQNEAYTKATEYIDTQMAKTTLVAPSELWNVSLVEDVKS